jgi:NAD(P)-dependent dehydrogenase (short-subunit alcohol dehydrogenase family)
MVSRVLILGGYGNFGSHIARRLAADANIQLLIGGRSPAKAEAFAAGIEAARPVQPVEVDLADGLTGALAAARPDLVIHTVGPFQGQDYRVPEACIAAGACYVDLADARAFVTGIGALDERARAVGVAVVSGASSVPTLTAAIVDRHRGQFARIDAIDYGITTAEQGSRGLSTAASVLSYAGKPFRALRGGEWVWVHGWQGLRAEAYPELGTRLFGDCDIPDLDLFPARWPELETVRFGAGHEVRALHLGTWALSWLVRWGLIPRLSRIAPFLLRTSRLFDRLGTGRSGLHMILRGVDSAGAPKSIRFFLIARRGHGPVISCIPAILLAQRFARGEAIAPGARPCLDLIGLDDYLAALAGLDISTRVLPN